MAVRRSVKKTLTPTAQLGIRMHYSNSYIASYKECPLRCHLTYDIRLEKIEKGTSEHHLQYGRAMHEALKKIYLGSSLESAVDSFKESYPIQLDETDKAKTQINGIKCLEEYVKQWSTEDKKWKVISVEEKETFDYVEDGFTVVLDLVVENKEHGGIYGFDHKIVGGKRATLSLDFWGQFDLNSQITKYYSFIKSKYGDCSGFYINAIGMRWLERKYKDSPVGLNFRFGRMMYSRNIDQLAIEQADTEYWINRIEADKRSNYWGMNTDSCKFCQYREICLAGWRWPTDKELIEINYQVSEKENQNANRSGISSVQT